MARPMERACVKEFEGFTKEELVVIILEQRGLILALREEVEELRCEIGGGGKGRVAAPWAKANRPEKVKKDRKKRKKSFVRRRETPTEVVEHAVDTCPDSRATSTLRSSSHAS